MNPRYSHSRDLTNRTRLVTPGGAQTMSKRPDRFTEGAFPAYLERGLGARVWDVDGNCYVDWICGLGAISLGYNHKGVWQRVTDALSQGLLSPSLPTRLEEWVASHLVRIIPCAGTGGQVRFVKTGSEACQAAVRIARRYTERDLVIVVGYHGWHDWVQVTSPSHPGIPECYAGGYDDGWERPAIVRVPYNDAHLIESLMRRHKVAAVMLEPTLLTPPNDKYLETVVGLCTLHGAVSIFDETVMGFRWARAGGQEFFNVTPNMAVYGKALANGLPLACVVGPGYMMKNADVISGTFGGETLSLAAALAVLDAYSDTHPHDGPIGRQWRHGTYFMELCRGLGIPVTGYAVHPKVTYEGEDMARFLQETAKRGVLLHPGGFNVSAALTPDDLEVTYMALNGAKDAVDAKVPLEGAMPQEGILKRLA